MFSADNNVNFRYSTYSPSYAYPVCTLAVPLSLHLVAIAIHAVRTDPSSLHLHVLQSYYDYKAQSYDGYQGAQRQYDQQRYGASGSLGGGATAQEFTTNFQTVGNAYMQNYHAYQQSYDRYQGAQRQYMATVPWDQQRYGASFLALWAEARQSTTQETTGMFGSWPHIAMPNLK